MLAWLGVFMTLGLSLMLVARSCNYEWSALARYTIYFLLFVVLPGVVALHAIDGRPVSLTLAIALGVPTGFAIEIATFLGASALGVKTWLGSAPIVWAVAAIALRWRRGKWAMRWNVTARHAGLALGLSVVFLTTIISAASQMFAESPLVGGLPQRPIFHDWVYLVSRAAAIKQHWPLEDPSLSGTSLQYHYFMMVHAAAASWVTHVEITLVLLRLMIVVLGAVLVAQAFVLGLMLSQRAWGGVIAAWLTVATTELSGSTHYDQPEFLGLFVRWLYVSPTFFFGVIFFGALIIAVARFGEIRRMRALHFAWLALLTAAATGAKGTVLPVVLVAIALWLTWRLARDHTIPRALMIMGMIMGGVFLSVYFLAMSAWGTGAASLDAFQVFHLAGFWQHYVIPWQRALKHWLHAPDFGTWLGASLCALAVLAGSLGVQLLAIPYVLRPAQSQRRDLTIWLSATALASCAAGTFIHLDSNGELYFILLMRLPLAVLATGFLVGALTHWVDEYRARQTSRPDRLTSWSLRGVQRGIRVLGAAGVALCLLLQSAFALLRDRDGLEAWLRFTPDVKINDDLLPLYDAMQWLRDHTESDAVLVANAFTSSNLRSGRGILVDHTTAGVYYYYSALSERRLWIEGPSYLLDVERVQRRLRQADRIFYHHRQPTASMMSVDPCYIVLDHGIGDGASVALPDRQRVYSNGRFEIFRILRRLPAANHGVLASK